MASVDCVYSGLSNTIHGDFAVPDWLSAEQSTGVSKLMFYYKDLDAVVLFRTLEHICDWYVS
jgi:hypothetical protein